MSEIAFSDVVRAINHTRTFQSHIDHGGKLLDAPMLNGKTLGECTGKEIGEMGEWLLQVQEHINGICGRPA